MNTINSVIPVCTCDSHEQGHSVGKNLTPEELW